jgi:hypothetical protein
MAKTKLARRSVAAPKARTRTIVVQRARGIARRVGSAVAGKKQRLTSGAVTMAGAAALGVAERDGRVLPTVADLDPGLVYGLGAALAGLYGLKGKTGSMLADAGFGAAAVGLHRSIQRGSARVSGDDDEYDD